MESDNSDQDPSTELTGNTVNIQFNLETQPQPESPEPTSQQPAQPLQPVDLDLVFVSCGVHIPPTCVEPPIARVMPPIKQVPVPHVASYPESEATFNSCSIQSQLMQALDKVAELKREICGLKTQLRVAPVRLGQQLDCGLEDCDLPPRTMAASTSTCSEDTQTEVPVAIPITPFVPPPRKTAEAKSTRNKHTQTEGPVAMLSRQLVLLPRRSAEAETSCFNHPPIKQEELNVQSRMMPHSSKALELQSSKAPKLPSFTGPTFCGFCDKRFKTPLSLSKHKSVMHRGMSKNVSKVFCQVCEVTVSKNNLSKHKQTSKHLRKL